MARNTVQQAIIEEALHALDDHPTAEEVFARVNVAYPSIGKATVYRTLNRLVENGRAIKVPMSDGADRFDYRTTPHYHVCCRICGRVDDVCMSVVEDLNGKAARSCDYRIDSFSLQFSGVCPDCATAAGRGRTQQTAV